MLNGCLFFLDNQMALNIITLLRYLVQQKKKKSNQKGREANDMAVPRVEQDYVQICLAFFSLKQFGLPLTKNGVFSFFQTKGEGQSNDPIFSFSLFFFIFSWELATNQKSFFSSLISSSSYCRLLILECLSMCIFQRKERELTFRLVLFYQSIPSKFGRTNVPNLKKNVRTA